MNSNEIDSSLPPKIALEQYANEISGIISRIETNLNLLERQTTYTDAGKQTKENIEGLLATLKRVTTLAKEYTKSEI